MKRSLVLLFSFLFCAMTMLAQESSLANQYYRDGEYEKASKLYKKLAEKNTNSDYYFDQYIKTLIALEEYDNAEKSIKAQIKKFPQKVQLYVTYGSLLEQQNDYEKADKQYLKAINNLPADVSIISRLGNAYSGNIKYDLAIQTFEKGRKLLNNDKLFSKNLANVYRLKGDKTKMLENYLDVVVDPNAKISSIQSNLHREIKTEEEFTLLKTALFTRIQDYPDNTNFPELLAWTYIQSKDYNKAFKQVRSIDRTMNENGTRVYQLAALAEDDKDYETAIDAYNFLVEDKGPGSSYYVNAKRSVLRCKRKLIMQDYKLTPDELTSLDNEYKVFLDEFGINSATAKMTQEYAEFVALYANDISRGIELLNILIKNRGLKKDILSSVKIDLADYYLIDGNIWEATLLYSQVDKDHQEEYIGELARFKNAKFSYFTGDFEWAQAQFDILKTATSRLISNDAIDMSVFIMDNLGLDTTAVPLSMFAGAELLAYQHQFDAALDKLDSILILFPDHGLKDDILYTQADIFKDTKNYDQAVKAYEEIIAEYPEEIRADNSIYKLAEMYETVIPDVEKAKTLYEKLFIDYSNSTLAVEARKRYRVLRGDEI